MPTLYYIHTTFIKACVILQGVVYIIVAFLIKKTYRYPEGSCVILKDDNKKTKRLRLVDKCLLIFLFVMLAQSAYSLLVPSASGSSGVDTVIRTATAGIFGYFLSANFARDAKTNTTQVDTPNDSDMPKEADTQIAPTSDNELPFSKKRMPPGGNKRRPRNGVPKDAQVYIATAIGLFCLLCLLILRNWVVVGEDVDTTSLIAIASQFRDFVSGSVGFLLGQPDRG